MSATALPARRRPSPRTAELPMAFTGWEFTRGALTAWGLFLILFGPVMLGLLVVPRLVLLIDAMDDPVTLRFLTHGPSQIPQTVLLSYIYAIPSSMIAVLVGGALAYAIGHSLRRVRHRGVHLAAFALLGLAVGAGTTLLFIALTIGFDTPIVPALTVGAPIALAATTGLAVALGWTCTVRRALRADARAMAEAQP